MSEPAPVEELDPDELEYLRWFVSPFGPGRIGMNTQDRQVIDKLIRKSFMEETHFGQAG